MNDEWKLQRFDEIVGDIMTRNGHELGADWTKQKKIEFINDILEEFPQVSNNTTIGDNSHE